VNFSQLLLALAGPIAKKVMAALGLGVLTYAAVQAAFSAAQNALLASYGQISADIVGPLNMAGFGQAVGIILGALSARLALQAVSKLGRIAA
jgi:hypothetical protein